MKKTILILLMLLFFTGCTTNYNLNINNDNIKESIELNIPASLSSSKKDKIDEFFNENVDVYTNTEDSNTEFYDLNKSFVKNGYVYKLNYKYSFDKFSNARSLNECFDDFQYKNTDEYIAIKASGKFYCKYDNTKVNIKIKTDNYVSDDNAMTKEDGTYLWTIDDANKENTNIEFMMYKNLPKKEDTNTGLSLSLRVKNILIILFLIIFLFTSGILINKVLKKIDSI